MKTTMIMIAIAIAAMSFNTFAEEVATDCPWSNDTVSRQVNEKANSDQGTKDVTNESKGISV